MGLEREARRIYVLPISPAELLESIWKTALEALHQSVSFLVAASYIRSVRIAGLS